MRRAVLFDMDGVLAPTESLRGRAHQATVSHFGGSIPGSLYREIGVGKPHEQVRAEFIRCSGIAVSAEEYAGTFRKVLSESVYGLCATPGIPRLLRTLRDRNYRLAVVSSSAQVEVGLTLCVTNLAGFFEVFVTGDDVVNKKPAPDAYLLALKRLEVERTFTVVIEDSEDGIRAALTAGLRVIGFRHEYNRGHDFCGVPEINSFLDAGTVIRLIEGGETR